MSINQSQLGDTSAGGGATDKAKRVTADAAEQSKEAAANVASNASDVAESAAQGAGDVKRVATEEAGQVAQDVSAHLISVINDAGSQLYDQASQQAKHAAGSLRQFSDGARALGEGRPEDAGMAGQYVQQAGSKLSEFADRLDSGGLDGLMDDIRSFARRKPATFLACAGIAGFAAGRFVRGAQVTKQSDENRDERMETGPAEIDLRTSTPRLSPFSA